MYTVIFPFNDLIVWSWRDQVLKERTIDYNLDFIFVSNSSYITIVCTTAAADKYVPTVHTQKANCGM